MLSACDSEGLLTRVAIIIVAGRKSPKSLYDPNIATMESDASAYDQSDATGFIRLNALRLKLRVAKGSGGSPELPPGR
jgi:argininosuccinate synthase